MNAQHTPGPWTAGKYATRAQWSLRGDGDRRSLGLYDATKSSTLSPEESEANARLIAAAPDLLRVLQSLATFLSRPSAATSVREIMLGEVRSVVAKATGQEQ